MLMDFGWLVLFVSVEELGLEGRERSGEGQSFEGV